MRPVLGLALFALAAVPAVAADGVLSLFDGDSTFGWSVDGDVKAIAGALVLTKATARNTTTFPTAYQVSLEASWDGGTTWHANVVRIDGSGRTYLGGLGQKARFDALLGDTKPGSPVVLTSKDEVRVRKLSLQPLDMKSLFNGKDLTGWKMMPDLKSKFTVTKDGWLNIKDGPGDLQTEGQWADFVLQLECRTNGTHLNSGVFFRAKPGERWQGYEAQINNNFDKPKTYSIDIHDPKTNELKGKEMVESKAVDFGTGAIYRRLPARRSVARDNVWFTLTVVAVGRHLSTWVDEVQTVDWTDNRPLNDNGRNGCRLEKGVLGLQGHDPTTDLDFRNLRIVGK